MRFSLWLKLFFLYPEICRTCGAKRQRAAMPAGKSVWVCDTCNQRYREHRVKELEVAQKQTLRAVKYPAMSVVCVVQTGVKHEGGGVVGIYTNRESAMNLVRRLMQDSALQAQHNRDQDIRDGFNSRHWEGHGTFTVDYESPDYTVWVDAAVFISLAEMTVLPQ